MEFYNIILKRYFIIFLLLITATGAYAQVREVVHHNGNYYSQATIGVDTIYNVSYRKDTIMVIVPCAYGIVYPTKEVMGQFITWRDGNPIYATPIVQYDSVAHRRNIVGDTLRIIFSNAADALLQYDMQPVVWQHRQVTITDSAQLLSVEQYKAIAQGGDTSQFIIEPTIIYTDTLYVRNIVDTVYKNSHAYVDLGLSVMWATCNVGAESPEEYGDYFAWGEVEPKEEYTWENYKWCDGDYTKLNKYCTKEQYGIVDNQVILELNDDAAHVNMGGNWRMPTLVECKELVSQCTWVWTTINGVNGHQITGPNGNSIFLPATGAITKAGLQQEGSSGYYWINSISSTNPYNADDIFNRPIAEGGMSNSYGINAYFRYIGRVIRPVCPKK